MRDAACDRASSTTNRHNEILRGSKIPTRCLSPLPPAKSAALQCYDAQSSELIYKESLKELEALALYGSQAVIISLD